MTAHGKAEGGEDAGAADAADVAAALRGDRAAQRALYDRHRPAVHRLARGFPALDADDAEDVVQDAFVRAFASLARLEQPARFGGWLLTIARNRAITRIARGRARSQLAEDLGREAEALGTAEAEAPDPEAGAELELVRRVVDELPEGPEKETVRLFYLEGQLTAREIAARLGVGKSAITMRLERFRAKVKRRLLAEVARLRGEES
ncbi:RNA polymerase sigma factor [Anaeromyxobacter sp. Red801]|uniref:RNA polymerase sigma factor n=1 Tax=Anaeromyxobacter sp. Red801 TaxID=3411632 RepID=UPI003B9DF163